jgi:hypothetical protein
MIDEGLQDMTIDNGKRLLSRTLNAMELGLQNEIYEI